MKRCPLKVLHFSIFLQIWDVRRRGCIRTLSGHEGPVNSLRFSPDGKWVASAGDDGVVKVSMIIVPNF